MDWKGVLLFLQLFLLSVALRFLFSFFLFIIDSFALRVPKAHTEIANRERASRKESIQHFDDALTLLIIDLHEIIVERWCWVASSSSNKTTNNRMFTCFSFFSVALSFAFHESWV